MVEPNGIPNGIDAKAGEDLSTTTVSTIVVHAGEHAFIVVALLKSAGYIELRIDEMRPGLLAIGGSCEEAAALVNIHEDLLVRLRDKEDQVVALLTRADNLSSEKKAKEAIIYGDMAKCLNEFEMLPEERKTWLECSLATISEIVDTTAQAMDVGSSVITQIRALGQITDSPERPQEILSSCMLIEKVMLRIASEWERIESLWKTEKAKISETVDELQLIEQWLKHAERRIKAVNDYGSRQLLEEGNAHQARLMQLSASGVADGSRISHLSGKIEEFLYYVKTRMNRSQRIQSFFQSAQTVSMLSQLSMMAEDMRNANAAMAGELFPLAQQKASTVIHEGKEIFDKEVLTYEEKALVKQRCDEMEAKLRLLEQLALERQKGIQEISQQLASLQSWNTTRAVPFLATHSDMGGTFNEAVDFVDAHKAFIEEVVNRDASVVSVMSKQNEMTSVEQNAMRDFGKNYEELKEILESRIRIGNNFVQVHFSVLTLKKYSMNFVKAANRLFESDRKAVNVFRMVLFSSNYSDRASLSTINMNLNDKEVVPNVDLNDVYKFAKDLEASFEALTSLLDTNRDFANEQVAGQVDSVFHLIEQTMAREKQDVERFVKAAEAVAKTDEKLNVVRSIQAAKNLIVDHDHQFTYVKHKWSEWQRNKAEKRKLMTIVEEVQMWQEDTWEIIRLLENTKTTTLQDSEGLYRRIKELKQTLAQQTTKLEDVKKHKIAEDMLRRVDELLRKQQLMKDRVAELEKKVETIYESFMEQEEIKHIRAPQILTSLKDAQVDEGSRFEFVARIEGEPEPKITWFKDGIDVKNNIDYRQDFVNGVASLVIEETFIEDTATYTVRAENAGGMVESSAKLVVKSRSTASSLLEEEKPRFIKQLTNVQVYEGQTAHLDCVVVGRPEPEVIWFKEEKTVQEDERFHLEFTGDHCSLTIERTVPSDAGMYTAKARNIYGESTNFCQLKVKVHGEPPPRVEWRFNEQTIQTSETVKIEEELEGWSRLLISPVTPAHAGTYSVLAENEIGETITSATLHVQPPSHSRTEKYEHMVQEVVALDRNFGFSLLLSAKPLAARFYLALT
uniref:Ig-like domain-containing protein n=1 Tax=Angiostrongylus cantonensis TaxID=6313 RepID=A0A0K0DFC0_ANGCA